MTASLNTPVQPGITLVTNQANPSATLSRARMATEAFAAHTAEGEQRAARGEYIPFSPVERTQTLLHRWQHMVEVYGDRDALEDDQRTLTYADTNTLANRIAHALLAHALPREVPVALLFEIECDMPVGMLAAWKAGHFIAWLEPRQPLARNQTIVADCGASVVVTNRKHAALARQLWPAPGAVIVIEELDANLPTVDPPNLLVPSDPAYLVYTSGSTGTPKGSVELHGNLVPLMALRESLFHFRPEERVAFLLYGVGVIFSLAVAWMYGGCFLPFDARNDGLARFSQWLITRRITFLVGGADVRTWLLALDGSEQFPDIRFLSLSTGPTYREHLLAYQRYLPDSCLFANLYSATEFRISALHFMDKTTAAPNRLLPAGYVPPTFAIEIWDDAGNVLPVNEAGEVVVISEHLTAGYWQAPELNAAKYGFDAAGRRYFRTGDLGRIDEQGCLWVLGRKDGFVKIRGNRVETAEVEVALLDLAGVREAAVIDRGESDEMRELLAFVAVSPTQDQSMDGAALREQLALRLPEYMVPAQVIVLEELPHNRNGKVARTLLREMAHAFSAAAHTPPSAAAPVQLSDTEQRVTAMAQELLEGRAIGLHDNFFDVGGHSLLVARLMLQIYRTYHVDLAPRDFFADPTIAGLAARIDAARRDTASHPQPAARPRIAGMEAVPVLPGTAENFPLFFCLGWNGAEDMLLRYHELIRRVDRQWPLYALVASGTDDPAAQFTTMPELVEAALAAVRTVQPHGPYLLLGECLGGKLAYELARALTQAGEPVSLLMMLDTPFRPSWAEAAPVDQVTPRTRAWLRHWIHRVDHHRQQLAGMGLKAGTDYVVERLAALLPRSILPKSSFRPRFIAHRRYADILQSYVAQDAYAQPVKMLYSHDHRAHEPLWAKLVADYEVKYVACAHHVYLREAGDEVAAYLNDTLSALQGANAHAENQTANQAVNQAALGAQ